MEFFNRDVETCCCCCELRTGNIVLGTINAIGSGLSVLVIFLFLNVENDDETDIDATDTAKLMFLLIVCLLKFFFDVQFIYGVVKGVQRIIRAYYIMYLVFVSLWGILAVLSIFMLNGSLFMNMIVHLLMDGYAFIVCRSYYRQLQIHEQV